MIRTSPSITVFPLSTLEGGDSGITGFTKIVWEVEGISEVGGCVLASHLRLSLVVTVSPEASLLTH
jgi:hypothetical protein